jgi:hypothetical protein
MIRLNSVAKLPELTACDASCSEGGEAFSAPEVCTPGYGVIGLVRQALLRFAIFLPLFVLGCSTTRLTDTSRTGIEQLLISASVDRCLDKVDFSVFRGWAVYVDDRYLDCVDRKYVVAALRRHLLSAGARVVEKAEEADIILEVSSGAVGTDRSEGFLGIPAVDLPGPVPVRTPELKLISQTTQFGTAKISLIAYDAKNRQALGNSALISCRAYNTNWFILGIGPFNSGTLRKDLLVAREEGSQAPKEVVSLIDGEKIGRVALRNSPAVPNLPAGSEGQESPPIPAATPWAPPPEVSHPSEEAGGHEHRGPTITWPFDPNFPPITIPRPDFLPELPRSFIPNTP